MRFYGNLNITPENQNEYVGLFEVTGYLYVDGSAKLDAPNLQTVGGGLYVDGSAKLYALKNKNDINAKNTCQVALAASFLIRGLIKIDGILSWILGEKKIGDVVVFEIQIVGKLHKSYVVKRGDTFSHGETVEKAIEDLRYKIGNRDTTKFEYWRDLKTSISLDEAITGYRVITGACEFGVKEFVKSAHIPDILTPEILLNITEGKFGNDKLSEFLVTV